MCERVKSLIDLPVKKHGTDIGRVKKRGQSTKNKSRKKCNPFFGNASPLSANSDFSKYMVLPFFKPQIPT